MGGGGGGREREKGWGGEWGGGEEYLPSYTLSRARSILRRLRRDLQQCPL